MELEDCAASVRSVFEPDATALRLDNSAYDGKPHTATLNFISWLESLKHLEDPIRIFWSDSFAVVSNGEHEEFVGHLA